MAARPGSLRMPKPSPSHAHNYHKRPLFATETLTGSPTKLATIMDYCKILCSSIVAVLFLGLSLSSEDKGMQYVLQVISWIVISPIHSKELYAMISNEGKDSCSH